MIVEKLLVGSLIAVCTVIYGLVVSVFFFPWQTVLLFATGVAFGSVLSLAAVFVANALRSQNVNVVVGPGADAAPPSIQY